jgi:hypothetical protein
MVRKTGLERQARPGRTGCCGAGGVAGARKTSRPPVITVAGERKPGPDDLGPRCPVIGGRPAGSAYGRPCRTSSVVSTTATTSRASHLRRQDETACSPGAGPNMDTTSRPCSDTAAATFPCGQAGRLTHAGVKPSASLDLGDGFGLAVLDGGLERGVVAFVLVGVGFGEADDRPVELARAAEVGSQGYAVAGELGPSPAPAGRGDIPWRGTTERTGRYPGGAVGFDGQGRDDSLPLARY